LFKEMCKRLKSLDSGVVVAGKEKRIPKSRQLVEMKQTLQRLQAEFENYIKRAEREISAAKERGSAEAIAKMLPLLDSVDAAVENAEKAARITKEGAVTGLKNLRSQLLSIMGESGLEEIQCLGKPFDAELHEAVLTASDDKAGANTVLEVVHKGYLLNGKVLRHAKVKINQIKGGEQK
jgi:molecular chaperone GrpE